MDVWFKKKIVSEQKKEYKCKGISYSASIFKTERGRRGIRVPLTDNHELLTKFAEWVRTLPELKLGKTRAKKYNIVPFSHIGENDPGLDKLFPLMGFYVLGDYLIFLDEPWKTVPSQTGSYEKPKARLDKFINYYAKKFKLI